MSINNREDANRYYQLINNLVDEYTERWKIRPSNLKRYLKPGSERFNKFLERNKLKDVKGSEIILKDIIEDRNSLEKDGVMTFESYKVFESDEFKISSMKECLYKGIEKSTQKMEKILADYFDTNLSDIDIVDSEKHKFKVNNWDKENVSVIIYSEEEFEVIKSNIIEHLYGELEEKEVEITSDITLSLSELIDKETYEQKLESKLTKQSCIKFVEQLTGSNFEGESESYLIFIM
jgi:hypothetical protein